MPHLGPGVVISFSLARGKSCCRKGMPWVWQCSIILRIPHMLYPLDHTYIWCSVAHPPPPPVDGSWSPPPPLWLWGCGGALLVSDAADFLWFLVPPPPPVDVWMGHGGGGGAGSMYINIYVYMNISIWICIWWNGYVHIIICIYTYIFIHM